MMMRRVYRFTAGMVAALALSGCVRESVMTPHEWALRSQDQESRQAHLKLAEHYDELGVIMEEDAEEERAVLENYMKSPHRQGKQILNLKSRSKALIRDFEMSAEQSRELANYHRKLADSPESP
jgi:hypothetical protein